MGYQKRRRNKNINTVADVQSALKIKGCKLQIIGPDLLADKSGYTKIWRDKAGNIESACVYYLFSRNHVHPIKMLLLSEILRTTNIFWVPIYYDTVTENAPDAIFEIESFSRHETIKRFREHEFAQLNVMHHLRDDQSQDAKLFLEYIVKLRARIIEQVEKPWLKTTDEHGEVGSNEQA